MATNATKEGAVKGPTCPAFSARPHGAHQVTRSPYFRGFTLLFSQSGFLNFILRVLIDFLSSLKGFWPFWGDIGPFFRPDLGEKLGGCYQLQAYKNHRFLNQKEEVYNRFMLKDY
jgi:hypothetical protein